MNPQTSSLIDGVSAFVKDIPIDVKTPKSKRRSRGKLTFEDSFLEVAHYKGGGKNIVAIGDQINATYEFELYDACAVLCRRLLESLLILSFKHSKVEARIKDPAGKYLFLSNIVTIAKSDPDLDLSRNVNDYLHDIVEVGNLSAHSIFIIATKRDLDLIKYKFRIIIEELMHKAGKHA